MCLSHLIYTVRPCLIYTCHAMPMLCSDHAVLLKAAARHVRWEMACGLTARIWLPRGVPRSYDQTHTNLRCRWPVWNQTTFVIDKEKSGSSTLQNRWCITLWTSSSDISGYHADIHEAHGTVGAGQGNSMLCGNRPLVEALSYKLEGRGFDSSR